MITNQNKEIIFTRQDVVNLVSTIHAFFDKTGELINQYKNEPAPNSIASKEISSFPNQDLLSTVYSQGNLSMESAGDHLVAFADLITEPLKTIAPWTCVRGLLESSALACWFLDPTFDAISRVGRSFAFRYKGFEEQIKFLRITNDPTRIQFVENRIIKVENDALAIGFSRVVNKSGKRIGIAQVMPGITELIGQILDKEFDYRLLSGVAHGHHWATHQIGFKIIEVENNNGNKIKALEKAGNPNFIIYVGLIAVSSFSKVLWYIWQLNGWDLEEIKSLLESTYDQLKYNSNIRFWRVLK